MSPFFPGYSETNVPTYFLSVLNTAYPAKVIYLDFHPFEVVSCYQNPQLQVGENYSYLFNLRSSLANPDV